MAFRAGDNEAMKVAQRDLNKQLKEFIRKCRERAEQDLANSNIKRLNSEYELMSSRRRYRSADIIGTTLLFLSQLNKVNLEP